MHHAAACWVPAASRCGLLGRRLRNHCTSSSCCYCLEAGQRRKTSLSSTDAYWTQKGATFSAALEGQSTLSSIAVTDAHVLGLQCKPECDLLSIALLMQMFLAAGQERWGQQSRLVLLLPHGLEGQGPDHSSARLERFLALVNDDPAHLPGLSPAQRAQVRLS